MNVFFYFYIMIHNAPLFYTRCVAENFTSFAFPVSALHYIRAKEYTFTLLEKNARNIRNKSTRNGGTRARYATANYVCHTDN